MNKTVIRSDAANPKIGMTSAERRAFERAVAGAVGSTDDYRIKPRFTWRGKLKSLQAIITHDEN